MTQYIFKDFLDNKESYLKSVELWSSVVGNLLKPEKYEFDEYVATSDGFGNDFLDGNPIFSFKIDSLNKGVRIIQNEPDSSAVKLSAWLTDAELANGNTINELVINLGLTAETIFLTVDLINAWILNDSTVFRMKRYIETINILKSQISGLQQLAS